jgi:hypothetical protein
VRPAPGAAATRYHHSGTVFALLALDGIADGAGGQREFQTFSFDRPWRSLASVTIKDIGSRFVGSAASEGRVDRGPT